MTYNGSEHSGCAGARGLSRDRLLPSFGAGVDAPALFLGLEDWVQLPIWW